MAGPLGLEPRPMVLKADMLPITPWTDMATGCLRVFSRGFYSHGRTGHIRTFELPARLVGVLGFEPRAFRSQTERSTKLSYAPNLVSSSLTLLAYLKRAIYPLLEHGVGVEPTNKDFADPSPADEDPMH